MVDVMDIETDGHLKTWLGAQTPDIGQAIAARAALRALPTVMTFVERTSDNVNAGASLLACLRATIVTCAATQGWSEALVGAAKRTIRAAPQMYPSVTDRTATLSAMSAAGTVAHLADGPIAAPAMEAIQYCLDTARSSALTAGLMPLTTNSPAFEDANGARSTSGQALFMGPLWPDPSVAPTLLDFWHSFARDAADNPKWSYWIAWYRGYMEGAPLDWALQQRIALIDDKFWKAGAQAVADEIHRTQSDLQTKAEAEAKAKALAAAAAAQEAARKAEAAAKAQARIDAAAPQNLAPLLGKAQIAPPVLDGLADLIRSALSVARQTYKPDSLPPAVAPFALMPDLAHGIATKLRQIPVDAPCPDDLHTDLTQAVGQLNAELLDFESALASLCLKGGDHSPPQTDMLGLLINDRALFGGLLSAIWMLREGEKDRETRLDAISKHWQILLQ